MNNRSKMKNAIAARATWLRRGIVNALRIEFMYKWNLLKHYRRMHGLWRALRFTFGNYYVMPVDHAPSAEELCANEDARYARLLAKDDTQ